MAAWRSTIERKTPRLSRRRVKTEKKPSTALSQDALVGVKWKTHRGWRASQARTLGCFVGGVVVDDGVDDLAGRDCGLDLVQEADELLMPVALHAAADHRPVQDVERGEQGGRAVALVVVGHGSGAALLDRQSGLCAVQGLDLALLVHRQNHGVSGRIDVEPDHVGELLDEPGVLRQLKGPHPVGRKAVGFPDALDADHADPCDFGHGAGRPVCRLARRVGQGQLDHLGHGLGWQRRLARLAGLVAKKAVYAFAHEALLPAPDRGLGQPRAAHDLVRAQAVSRRDQRLGARHVLLRTVGVADDRLKLTAILRRDGNGDPCPHTQSMNRFGPSGIPLNGPIH